MADNASINRAQYLAWLRREFPSLYQDAVASLRDDFERQQMAGLFDSIGNAFTSIVDNVTKNLPQLAQTYAQYDAQKDLLRANTERARQGLAPLQYNSQGQLVTASGLPYTAEDYQIAQRGYGMDTPTLLLLVGGVALVFFILLSGRSTTGRR